MIKSDRRRFLRVAGATAVVGFAAACQSNSGGKASQSTTATTTNPPTATTPPTTSASATPTPTQTPTHVQPADYTALGRGLHGTVIRPGDATYVSASHLFNPRFDAIRPQAVIQCANSADVVEAVKFGTRFDLPIAVRSGGHCYAGWSTGPGIVIDTGPMHGISVTGNSATIGAGARLIDVYAALAGHGVGISGGSCPSVGITGLTLGGGIGVVDRAWGLACDNLTTVQIVTADGQLVTCDTRQNPDLYWASRGGAGGTFGVVTALTFRTRPIQQITTWYLSWPWSAAASVVAGWQAFVPKAPDELWGSVHLASAPNSATPSVSVVGTFLGGDPSASLNQLVAAIGSEPGSRSSATREFLDTMLLEAGCSEKGLAGCHLTPAGSVDRQAYSASSDWINTPMSQAGNQALVNLVQQRHDTAGVPDVAIQLDAAGGAINRISPTATAFVHRRAICSVQYIANWYTTAVPTEVAAWPHRARTAMQPYVSGEAYQNYADPQIRDWQKAYFGVNYGRLQHIKRRYDPRDVFHHQQSVAAR